MSSKGYTTAAKKDGKPALVPELRFPEFRDSGGWEQKYVEDFFNVGSSKRVLQQDWIPQGIPFYRTRELVSLSKNESFSSEVFISKALFEEITQKYGAPREGDFLVSGVGTLGISYLVKKGDEFYFKDGNVLWFARKDGVSSLFFKYCFESDIIQGQIRKQASISTVGTYTIQNAKITWLFCPPSEKEQQKIADCLDSADALIAAQGRKVEALKAHKKGLMQQLFPQEGETQPRLRFPEFQETGEWKEKALETIAPLQRGFDLTSDEIRPGSVPIVYSNGPKGFHETGMAKGPGLVTGRSGTIGKLHFIEGGEYWPHNTSLWVTSFKGHVPKFVYYLYESIGFLRFASGSGVPTLNRNDAHSFLSSVPPETKEQQCIADCLTSLDDLIAAQTQKLDTLKTHKKGLMRQLFPQIGEG